MPVAVTTLGSTGEPGSLSPVEAGIWGRQTLGPPTGWAGRPLLRNPVQLFHRGQETASSAHRHAVPLNPHSNPTKVAFLSEALRGCDLPVVIRLGDWAWILGLGDHSAPRGCPLTPREGMGSPGDIPLLSRNFLEVGPTHIPETEDGLGLMSFVLWMASFSLAGSWFPT